MKNGSVLRLYKQSALFRLSAIAGSVAVAFYIANKVYITNLFDVAFAQYYLNDVLAGVLIVSFVNILAVISNQRKLLLTKPLHILVFTLICGLFWEYVTPLYLTYSVSDPFDVIAYMCGGLLNLCIIRGGLALNM